MKLKIILSAVVIILILALAGGAVWWRLRPQVITFDDGSKLTLLAVQYGKHHEPPTVSGAKRGRAITTTNDTLVVWIQEQYDNDNQYRSFQLYAYDKAMTACVGAGGLPYYNGKVNQVVGVRVPAFPRRQGGFILRVQEQGNGGQEMADTVFHIRHVTSDFRLMTPDTLPSSQDDNDLSVTLSKLVTGDKSIYNYNDVDANDPMNKAVQAIFQVQRNGHSVTNWQPVAVETTDATGNEVSGQIENNQWQDASDTMLYQFGLWPDEPAWKMRFEFSQQSDFAPEELWSVPNIPVLPGKQQDFWNGPFNRRGSQNNDKPYAESDVNGYHLKVFPAKSFTDVSPNSQPQGGMYVQVTPPLPDGMRLTITRLTDDQTNDINFYEYTWNPGRGTSVDRCQLQNLGDATNLNLTIALHKSRFVEFTAKPEIAPPLSDNSQ
ncbi:MAG TPA: hypothetical protein VGN23_06565 [Verrucomicrobiae bacterium]|jgi:hypothetical protein